MRNRRFVYITAQLADDVKKRGPFRMLCSPLGVIDIIFGPAWPKALQRSQQQQAIGSYRQSRMTRYGLRAAHLRLPNTQDVFLIAMIHLDLPSIKAGLNQQLDGSLEIGCQKVSRLPIVLMRVLGQLVRDWSDHDQAQQHGPSAALPQHVFHIFVSHHTSFPLEVNSRPVPGAILLRAHPVGSEQLLGIFAAPPLWSPKAQPSVLAAASQQVGAIQLGLEHRLVGEAAIADNQQPAGASASLVQACTQVSNDLQRLSREILLLLQLVILFKHFLACAFWLLKWRGFLKLHRNPAPRVICLPIIK